MPSEWFHAAKVQIFLGIPLRELYVILLQAGVIDANFYLLILSYNAIAAPVTPDLRDRGITEPDQDNPVVVIPVTSVQIDAGLNEIPQATVQTAVGREGILLAEGVPSAATVSPAQLIEKFLSTTRVPARLYCKVITTAMASDPVVADAFDKNAWPDEWVVLFDGAIAGISRQGSAASSSMMIHLNHFLTDLTFSSSMTAHSAAGTFVPVAMSPLLIPGKGAGVLPASLTMAGSTMAALAGGQASDIDFWGFIIPGGINNSPPTLVGLKGFLYLLANTDVFAFEALTNADLGTSACTAEIYGNKKNDRALAALSRIEPFWPNWTGGEAGAVWNSMNNAIIAIRAERQAAGSTQSISRSDLILRISPLFYFSSGYRYGMPIPLYVVGSVLANLSTGRAFAQDIAGATFGNMTASSFWDLIAGPYSSNYQIALSPMADRAVMLTSQPLLDRYWQSIGSSEVMSWDRDFKTPRPLRGIVMTGSHPSLAGVRPAGQDGGSPGAQARFQQLASGYDSCDDGVFEFRALPPWLSNWWMPSSAAGGITTNPFGRATAAVPWFTGRVAKSAVDAIVGSIPLPNLALAYAFSGVLRDASAAPPPGIIKTIARMAKVLYQQERTRHNTYYVTTRFRYDIAPGSVIKVAIPNDKFVRESIPALGAEETAIYGMVLRVSFVVDSEALKAETHLQIGFCRTPGQAAPNSKLFSDSHPFWSTSCLGVPWSDAVWIRNKLGFGSSLADPDT